MDTLVLKFGGSSVSDNINLQVVAEKIISLKKEAKNIAVVVSAQGNTTNELIKQAQELSAIPDERELDVLLSTGEQISAAKLAILLNRLGHKAISLTGWQAGIKTNNVAGSAKIKEIFVQRIEKEFEKGKIVVVTGFQGINDNEDITTLGRGGSDTSAVALQAALNAEKCYIFSDVDGVYSSDPNLIKISKKLNEISFDEMQEISDAGAKVLHNRCIQLGKKFDLDIFAKSTFSDNKGTKITQQIESSEVKNIVKNDNLIQVFMKKKSVISDDEFLKVYRFLLDNNIITELYRKSINKKTIQFVIKKAEQNKVQELLEKKFKDFYVSQKNFVKLAIIGYGITQDNEILKKVISILKKYDIKVQDINLNQMKIEIILNRISNDVVNEIHKSLIK